MLRSALPVQWLVLLCPGAAEPGKENPAGRKALILVWDAGRVGAQLGKSESLSAGCEWAWLSPRVTV